MRTDDQNIRGDISSPRTMYVFAVCPPSGQPRLTRKLIKRGDQAFLDLWRGVEWLAESLGSRAYVAESGPLASHFVVEFETERARDDYAEGLRTRSRAAGIPLAGAMAEVEVW